VPREAARQSAVRHLIDTFFEGSAHHAVAALIDMQDGQLSQDELDRLSDMIDRARKDGR
jgi:BlaI family transcriptional regulator, penicillinase repressor